MAARSQQFPARTFTRGIPSTTGSERKKGYSGWRDGRTIDRFRGEDGLAGLTFNINSGSYGGAKLKKLFSWEGSFCW